MVLLAALVAVGCGAGIGCGGREAVAPPPNLVLISIDSLRADRLGCYGAERDTSPAMDRLCRRGVRFSQAVAPTSWTLPSHVTLLTGLPIPAHRVVHQEVRIDPARRLLAEHLAGLGYRSAGFVSAPFLHAFYGFDRGFERYVTLGAGAPGPPFDELHAGSHRDETAPQVIDASLDWLAGQPLGGPTPWFLFVHLWDVHYDFLPPAPYDRLFAPDYAGGLDPRDFNDNPAIHAGMPESDLAFLRALYDGEIRWLDSQLARLLAVLEAREERERIVIALVSDHGDEFFEHGKKGHFKELYEESVRIPWILVDRGRLAPREIESVAGLDDVAPTLLGLAGLSPLPEALGRNLAPALESADAIPAEPKLLTLRQVQALRGDGWKVVHDSLSGYASYYDLRADPGELSPQPARSQAPERLAELERLQQQAERHAAGLAWSDAEATGLTPELEARLRELGYLE